MANYDVIVAGLGIAGSWAAHELAARGQRVLGLDRWRPPHTRGSSHGRSRIIREAYFENPLYVPLVREALRRWNALEREAGVRLFVRTGVLTAGPPEGALVRGALESARLHGVPHESLGAAAIRKRFPALRPDDSLAGVLEPDAGMLLVEPCIEAILRAAAGRGAELRFDEPVLDWEADDGRARVRTASGSDSAGSLVLAAGSWLPALLASGRTPADPASLPLVVERQVVAFFRAEPMAPVGVDACPITLLEPEPGRVFYTLPDAGDGVKAGLHHEGDVVDPDRAERRAADEDIEPIRSQLSRWMHGVEGEPDRASVCLYTNTPDLHFVIDHHPAAARVIVVSACSGHGFKFAPAIGGLVADLALHGRSRTDASPFRWSRFDSP